MRACRVHVCVVSIEILVYVLLATCLPSETHVIASKPHEFKPTACLVQAWNSIIQTNHQSKPPATINVYNNRQVCACRQTPNWLASTDDIRLAALKTNMARMYGLNPDK